MERTGRTIAKLSALKVAKVEQPGMYADGGGLYLQVSPGGKSWIFKFSLSGKSREMGLGSLATVSLQDARNQVLAARRLLQDGRDPIETRRLQRAQARLEAAKAVTFSECATRYIAAHKPGWRNAKHAQQWKNTLETYAAPVIGKVSIQDVDTSLVIKILEPIWPTKPETASRVRGRVEVILDWAKVQGLRAGDNPARWRGHLDKMLPKRSKIRKVRHHAALPYEKIPEFMKALREREGTVPRALEFAILTAARTGEILGAAPNEIDAMAMVWTVPASRMKGEKEHRVPLSARALNLCEDINRTSQDAFLFPSVHSKKALSNMAFLMTIERMGYYTITMHGFRSTFRDWAAEKTNHPRDVVEMALAHTIQNKVEAAYRRGDLFEKRRKLMEEWSEYCLTTPLQNVINLKEQALG